MRPDEFLWKKDILARITLSNMRSCILRDAFKQNKYSAKDRWNTRYKTIAMSIVYS